MPGDLCDRGRVRRQPQHDADPSRIGEGLQVAGDLFGDEAARALLVRGSEAAPEIKRAVDLDHMDQPEEPARGEHQPAFGRRRVGEVF